MADTNPHAQRGGAGYGRVAHAEVAASLDGAREIYLHESDNDKERLVVTTSGQYVRITGEDLDRFHLVDADEARELIGIYLGEEESTRLVPIGVA